MIFISSHAQQMRHLPRVTPRNCPNITYIHPDTFSMWLLVLAMFNLSWDSSKYLFSSFCWYFLWVGTGPHWYVARAQHLHESIGLCYLCYASQTEVFRANDNIVPASWEILTAESTTCGWLMWWSLTWEQRCDLSTSSPVITGALIFTINQPVGSRKGIEHLAPLRTCQGTCRALDGPQHTGKMNDGKVSESQIQGNPTSNFKLWLLNRYSLFQAFSGTLESGESTYMGPTMFWKLSTQHI